MKFKKIFSVFTICFFVCSVLVAAGLRFGMTGAVKQKVKDLDKKVIVKKAAASADTTAPTVSSTIAANAATGVAVNANITATFSEVMEHETITTATFTLMKGTTVVSGAVTYMGTTATLDPTSNLVSSTTYTATISIGAKDLASNALAAAYTWTFTTVAVAAPSVPGAGTGRGGLGVGPSPVDLGTAGNYVILSKSGISTVPTSAITGDIGVSPIDRTAITGFSETMDASNIFSTALQVTGNIYAADYAVPTPANMTTAVSDMETAYTNAAGRAADFTEVGAGNIGGMTLPPGTYKWGTSLIIPTDVTLSGGPNDVWIFEIAGDITMASAKNVTLAGGALPKNIFWQTFGFVSLGTTSHFEGVILSKTEIAMKTGATINGRLLSQTAVTLDQNAVTKPAP
ncbi:MAG: ice-binding family protein [Elusimicrobia bacterium]|nr:ice-binding family protein [Elusimicrobiota bacterium]